MCPNCGAAAADKLVIERAFLFSDEGSEDSRILRAAPLFCPNCIAQHWREAKPVPPLRRLAMALRTELTLAMIGPFLFGGFLFIKGLQDLARHGDLTRSVVLLAVATLFLLIGVACLVGGYSKTAYKAVTPPTSVTSAVDFTIDQSSAFEPEWHQFTFRSQPYGEAFATLNHDRIWDRHGAEARRAASRNFNLKILIYIAVGAFALYAVYDEYLRPFF